MRPILHQVRVPGLPRRRRQWPTGPGTSAAPVWGTMSAYSLTQGISVPPQALPVTVPGGGSPFIAIAWHSSSVPSAAPAWVTLTSGASPTIAFTGGQVDADDVSNMVLSAVANGSAPVLSAGVSITVSTSSTVPTFTANIGLDPFNAGEGSQGLGWPKGGIASDGMTINWCTDGYAQDDNSVRGFNMWPTARVDATGVLRPSSLGGTGWRRFGDDLGSTIGSYVSAHDNMPHFNLPSTNHWVTPSRGVFAVDQGAWISGNIMGPPGTTFMESTVQLMTAQDISEDRWGSNAPYNPMSQWVEAEEVNFVAGGAPSQTPLNAMWLIERTAPADGLSQKWKMTRKTVPAAVTTLAASVGCQQNRNLTCAVGPYVYFGVEQQKFWRMDMRDRTMQTVVPLADWPAAAGTYYALMTYDERRRKILIIGSGVWAYDIPTNTWADATPSGWMPAEFVVGDYSRDLDAHYFRATPVNYGQFTARAWHKLYLGNPTNNPRWRSQTVNLSPFKGLIEKGYGQNKHVMLAWHPVKKRLYNCGGDFGYGSADFGQPEGGANIATNNPGGGTTYRWEYGVLGPVTTATDSLRMDMYSIDPLASGAQNWRLEHPYYPRSVSGSPEQKPGFTDQVGWVWDDRPAGANGGQKFWCFQHHIRDDQTGIPRFQADGTTLDPWANGPDVFTNSFGKSESKGTYSWVPSDSGGAGTWTKETVKYMAGDPDYSNPAHVGDALRIYAGSPDHWYCGLWAQYKSATDGRFVSLFGDIGDIGRFWMTIFDPVAKTYDWRRLTFAASVEWCTSWSAPIVVVDDYAYTPVLTKVTGSKKCQILKVHIPTALAAGSSGGVVAPAGSSFIDAPFSFEPDGLWETQGTGGNLFHEVGLVGIDRKLVLIGSYGATLVKPSGTRIATYVPDTGRWVACDAFPGVQYNSKCWVAIPETGEVLMMPNSSLDDNAPLYSPHNTYWYYRVR